MFDECICRFFKIVMLNIASDTPSINKSSLNCSKSVDFPQRHTPDTTFII
jgi:hypothetical protein